jgi:hypothetical protein
MVAYVAQLIHMMHLVPTGAAYIQHRAVTPDDWIFKYLSRSPRALAEARPADATLVAGARPALPSASRGAQSPVAGLLLSRG